MLLLLLVTLYTSRVVLEQLGVVDYGVYNVVAGIIVLFSFITNSLQLASQRYFSYELENSKNKNITSVFKSSIKLYLVFSIIFVIVCQTLGYWLLITKLNIPIDRKLIAIYVFEISIITGVINIFRVPYNAIIIAYEELSVYAKYSIVEAILKIATIVLLIWINVDKLILYSVLVGISTLITNILYMAYCHKKLLFNFFNTRSEKEIMKDMFSFSSWMLLLGIANVSATQGINFILNIAYGVVINAAIGIANQVNSAVNQFVSNFQTSFNPQLVKFYAAKNYQQLFNLLFNGSRLSFFLLLVLSWPIIVNVDLLLALWLKDVPEYSNTIIIWVLIYALIDTFVNPIAIVVHATGRIKRYQFIASAFILSIIPFCFGCIYFSIAPYIIFMIRAIINFCSLVWRIYYLNHTIGMQKELYLKSVLIPCGKVLLISIALYFIILCENNEYLRLITSIIAWIIALLPAIYWIGLNYIERVYINKFISKLLHR